MRNSDHLADAVVVMHSFLRDSNLNQPVHTHTHTHTRTHTNAIKLNFKITRFCTGHAHNSQEVVHMVISFLGNEHMLC